MYCVVVNRLITISFSHYNEKARWALTYCGIPFVETPTLPFMHLPVVLRYAGNSGRSDRVSSRFSTPAFVSPDGAFCDSTAIAEYADHNGTAGKPSLIPDEHRSEILDLVGQLGQRLGPGVRTFGYWYILADAEPRKQIGARNARGIQRALWLGLHPVLGWGIKRALGINPKSVERAKAKIETTYDVIDELLSDGRLFLFGDHFTLADLTFAALTAPALLLTRDEGAAAWYPPIDDVPEPVAEMARSLRARPAGAFALRMYREHR